MTAIVANSGPQTFSIDHEIMEIAVGVSVSSNSNPAVYNDHYTDVVLLNYGSIFNSSTTGHGVYFYTNGSAASTGTIINQTGGSIAGATAVTIEGGFSTVDNRGSIFGVGIGVADYSNTGIAIENSGSIESLGDAIQVYTSYGMHTFITNSGIIRGGSHSIVNLGVPGGVSLSNTGTLFGDISLEGTGNDVDTIANSGDIAGSVHLGGGGDTFNGRGGTSGAVFGEAGDDHLIGGKSNDYVSGGGGNDTLAGGPGKDHFVFDTALATAGIDRIVGFLHASDKIDLKHAVFSALNASGQLSAGMFFAGSAAHDANDHIIYNPANGFLTYDSNGNTAGGAHHFATLAAHLTLTDADFVVAA